MLTVNIDLQDRLVKGQLGTIKLINLDMQSNVTKIYIKFYNCKAGLRKIHTNAFRKQHLWEPIQKIEVDIRIKATKSSSSVIKRTQYPLMLAWGCIVHKVQGLNLEKTVVSF